MNESFSNKPEHKTRVGLFWFTNDLRLHDQPALARASMSVDRLLCCFNREQAWSQISQSMNQSLGTNRKLFLEQSLDDLSQQLNHLGHPLLVTENSHFKALSTLIETIQPTDIFRSENAGWYENRIWWKLSLAFPKCRFHSIASFTLFDKESLPFKLVDMPDGFSGFRRKLETSRPLAPLKKITYLPPTPDSFEQIEASRAKVFKSKQLSEKAMEANKTSFYGGEGAALTHLSEFFSSSAPAAYKETRNALDGWDNSCKFSPWLSTGCLSVRKVLAELAEYEKKNVANESTYWIYFELLWREYFQWYAHRHGAKLYTFGGVTGRKPLTSYYGERFLKWVNGTTPHPIVNACMNELRETGFMSNRGRQIVASCFINELSLDWRYGAAYFESMLIDYDPATNWGNWQYLAGVGAANVTNRHFNLGKQTAQFDPHGEFISKWKADTPEFQLDSVDAADWPITN